MQVYGNIFVNGPTPPTAADSGTDNSTLIQIGDIFGTSGATHRTGTVHFHHNSLLVNSLRYQTSIFSFSEPQSVLKATNNIFHHTQSVGSSQFFDFRKYHGDAVLGKNWFRSGLTAGTGDGTITGFGSAISGSSPLVSWTDGALQNGSPCIDAGVSLPVGAAVLDAQYYPTASAVTRALSGSAVDIGAVEMTTTSPSGYDAWAYEWFGSNAALNAMTADPEGDGAANLMEYALGLDPTSAQASWWPQAVMNAGALEMTVNRNPNASDVQFIVEVSDDLVTWVSGSPHTTTVTNTASQLVVRDGEAGGKPRRFMRLRISH